MNAFRILILLLSICVLLDAQLQPKTSPRRQLIRPMTRNSVGRRGPVPPSPLSPRRATKVIRSPGFKPPAGIAKKLNDANDFRALARVLLKQ